MEISSQLQLIPYEIFLRVNAYKHPILWDCYLPEGRRGGIVRGL